MNDLEIDNNSSSSSNASADAYLASIRNRGSSRNAELNNSINVHDNLFEEIEEKAINREIIDNFKAIKQKKKKKKKNHPINRSLFDPEKYNKKANLTEQQQKWVLPPKKKPQKEIDEMVDRLSKPSPRLDFQIPEKLSQKKEHANPQIFDRLYEMSTEKEMKNKEKRIQQEKNNSLLCSSPKSNSKSQLLAEKLLLRFVENCFSALSIDQTIEASQDLINNTSKNSMQNEERKDENKSDNNSNNENKTNNSGSLISDINENNDFHFKNALTQEELDKLLACLGLQSQNENIPKFNKILFEKMNDWTLQEKQDGSRTYDTVKIYNEMIHVIKEGELSPLSFDKFARQRIIIALSNLKQFSSLTRSSIVNSSNTETLIKPSNESLDIIDENEANSSKTIQYSSIIRLSQSKRKNCKSPRRNDKDDDIHFLSIRPRPKFVMNPYSEELEPASISAKTEKIFRKSEVANIPFVEREQFFTEKRRKMIEKMTEESNKSQLMKFEHKPKFSKATKQELDEYKEKKEKMRNAQNVEPKNRIKTMNYEVYKKTIHKEMTEKKVRPKGWDNDITRHRIAYQRHLQEKQAKEENKEQEYDMLNELDIVSKYNL